MTSGRQQPPRTRAPTAGPDARVAPAPQAGAGVSGTRTEPAGAALALLLCWLVITTAWWALALAPVADPPPWLLVARSVCFGSTASGLPDTYGWLVLVAAPASMLAAILVVWKDDLSASLLSLAGSAAGRVVLAAVALFLAAATTAAASRIASGLAVENISYDPADMGELPDNYPRLGTEVPPLVLIDQSLSPFTKSDLEGRVTLLTFAFAHCHTVCPAIVQTMRSLAARLGDEAPQIVVITLDPWRDTPARLAQMHRDWQMPAGVRVLSGEVGDVTSALDGFQVPWTRDEATGDVTHPALVYAIGRDGRIAYGFNNPSVDWLAEAARRLSSQGAIARQ